MVGRRWVGWCSRSLHGFYASGSTALGGLMAEIEVRTRRGRFVNERWIWSPKIQYRVFIGWRWDTDPPSWVQSLWKQVLK